MRAFPTPALYDLALRRSERAGLAAQRRRLLARARGHVLEIGAGTGLNTPFYGEAVERLVLSDPRPALLRRAERRAVASKTDVATVRARAESLPFGNGSFDTVVSTLVLCSVEDLSAALVEVSRVLRPGGSLLFLEHTRSSDPRLARWQDRLDRPWRLLAGGCRPNRDTVAAIAAELDLHEVGWSSFPKAPPLVRPLAAGSAVAR